MSHFLAPIAKVLSLIVTRTGQHTKVVCCANNLDGLARVTRRRQNRIRSSLTQTFVESCVDFEVAHLSVLMVRSHEIPTLNGHEQLCSALHTAMCKKVQYF